LTMQTSDALYPMVDALYKECVEKEVGLERWFAYEWNTKHLQGIK
jgi:hypothetical protein